MTNITAAALQQQMQQAEQPPFLLDVRERDEHESFNIGGIWIPLGDIMSMAHTLPTNQPVIVYCKRGIRSQIAIQRLEAKFGFTNLINLEGGLESWK